MNMNKIGKQYELNIDENYRATMVERADSARPWVDFDPEIQEAAMSEAVEHASRIKQKRLGWTLNLVGKALTATTVFFASGYLLAGNPSVATIILSAFAAGIFLKKA